MLADCGVVVVVWWRVGAGTISRVFRAGGMQDGQRFEITRDEAKLSGLIKTMIEDEEGTWIEGVCHGVEVRVRITWFEGAEGELAGASGWNGACASGGGGEWGVGEVCGRNKTFMSIFGAGDGDEDVPLMDVKGADLAKVVEYLRYHATVAPPEIEKV